MKGSRTSQPPKFTLNEKNDKAHIARWSKVDSYPKILSLVQSHDWFKGGTQLINVNQISQAKLGHSAAKVDRKK